MSFQVTYQKPSILPGKKLTSPQLFSLYIGAKISFKKFCQETDYKVL